MPLAVLSIRIEPVLTGREVVSTEFESVPTAVAAVPTGVEAVPAEIEIVPTGYVIAPFDCGPAPRVFARYAAFAWCEVPVVPLGHPHHSYQHHCYVQRHLTRWSPPHDHPPTIHHSGQPLVAREA